MRRKQNLVNVNIQPEQLAKVKLLQSKLKLL